MDILSILALSFALAFLSESMVEYIFGIAIDKIEKLTPYRWLLVYVSLAAGVGMTYYYRLDLISLILEQTPTALGIFLSGCVIGRGANYLHQFISEYLPSRL